jgi:hypothetical protein
MARNNNNYNRNTGNNNSGQQKKKHSGAGHKTSVGKGGNPCTWGWNFSKRFGLVKFLCVFTSATKVVDSGRNRTWANVMVKITKPMSAPQTVSGMMDVHTGMVTIQDLGIVINPKAPNGGYCGKFTK